MLPPATVLHRSVAQSQRVTVRYKQISVGAVCDSCRSGIQPALRRQRQNDYGALWSRHSLFDQPVAATKIESAGGNLRDYLNECEREFITRALETSRWQIQTCADALGISRKTLWEKMRRLGIDREEETDAG